MGFGHSPKLVAIDSHHMPFYLMQIAADEMGLLFAFRSDLIILLANLKPPVTCGVGLRHYLPIAVTAFC